MASGRPQLIQRGLTVVCPDLRGYGGSRAPAPTRTTLRIPSGLPGLGKVRWLAPFTAGQGPAKPG